MSLTDGLKNLLRYVLQKLEPVINFKVARALIVLLIFVMAIVLFFFPSCDSTITLEEALDDLEFSPLEIFPVDLDLYFLNENSETSRRDIVKMLFLSI